jgi:uncharacterized Zn finger protein
VSAPRLPSRESAPSKGRRYLLEGRLTVSHVSRDLVRATCRGDGHVWRLGWSRGEGWWCSCPARGRCAHLLALALVVVVEEGSA